MISTMGRTTRAPPKRYNQNNDAYVAVLPKGMGDIPCWLGWFVVDTGVGWFLCSDRKNTTYSKPLLHSYWETTYTIELLEWQSLLRLGTIVSYY